MGVFWFFFFNNTATTEIYTLSLHDALPIYQLDRPPDRPAWAGRDRDRGSGNRLRVRGWGRPPRAVTRRGRAGSGSAERGGAHAAPYRGGRRGSRRGSARRGWARVVRPRVPLRPDRVAPPARGAVPVAAHRAGPAGSGGIDGAAGRLHDRPLRGRSGRGARCTGRAAGGGLRA